MDGPVDSQESFPEEPWFWEGNVQATLAKHLVASEWVITSAADTRSKAPGIDLIAAQGRRTLAIEVKGYPSTTYSAGPYRGQPKSTQPSTQARHWFSHAILSSMLMRQRDLDGEVWIAFPDFPSYRSLIERVADSLCSIGVGVFLIQQDGQVLELVGATTAAA